MRRDLVTAPAQAGKAPLSLTFSGVSSSSEEVLVKLSAVFLEI
jgi:hypothetical protein